MDPKNSKHIKSIECVEGVEMEDYTNLNPGAEDVRGCPGCAEEEISGTHDEGCPACAGEEISGMQGEGCPVCADRRTDRSDADKKALLSRLKRIEGQVRGLQGMVEKNAYCPDILVQVSAATSALNSFSKQLLASHIRGCVRRDIMNGDDAAIDELCQLLQRLMK